MVTTLPTQLGLIIEFFEVAKVNPLINCQFVENAGHFSFLSLFPSTIKDKVGLAAKDPDSFDREKFHKQLPKDILDSFNDRPKNEIINWLQ
jgi:hypothetical protein